jgi:outer membrane protein OmpA-like peptidoglycan-associated protein
VSKNFWLFFLFSALMNYKSNSQPKTDSVATIYFKSGKYNLDTPSKNILIKFFGVGENVRKIYRIAGFTDSVGSLFFNIKLSEKRSRAVFDFLQVISPGTSGCELSYYGKSFPVSQKENNLNRRVEIFYRVFKKTNDPGDTGSFKVVNLIRLKNLVFRPDEAILEPSSMPYLDNIVEILKADTHHIFEIKGHVNYDQSGKNIDSTYLRKLNKLSQDRAALVFNILVDRGIPKQRMFCIGMGNKEMIFPHASNDEEKRENMRVEIVILEKPD